MFHLIKIVQGFIFLFLNWNCYYYITLSFKYICIYNLMNANRIINLNKFAVIGWCENEMLGCRLYSQVIAVLLLSLLCKWLSPVCRVYYPRHLGIATTEANITYLSELSPPLVPPLLCHVYVWKQCKWVHYVIYEVHLRWL
jgi:hypothetical protein